MIFAYIDPGAGSMLIQVIIAGLLGVPYFFRARIRQLLSRWRR